MQCHWKQQAQTNITSIMTITLNLQIVVYVSMNHLKQFNTKAKDLTCQKDGNTSVKNSLHNTNQPANGLYNSSTGTAI